VTGDAVHDVLIVGERFCVNSGRMRSEEADVEDVI